MALAEGATTTTAAASTGGADTTTTAATGASAGTSTTTTTERIPSLLDRATAQTTTGSTTATTTATTQQQQPSVITLIDGKMGDIAVPQKFINADGTLNVANVLKSQASLETKLPKAALFTPPATAADYKFTPSEANKGKIDTIDPAEPVTKRFLEIMHKHGIPQDAFNELANATYEMAAAENGGSLDPKAIADAEFAKLGPNGQGIVDGLVGWLGALKGQGVLSDSELDEAKIMSGTAEGARVMLKLRELTGEQAIDLRGTVIAGTPSESEWRQWMGERVDPNNPQSLTKYETDENWRKKCDAAAEQIFGNQPAGTSKTGLGGVNVAQTQPARLMPAAPGRR